MAPTIHRERGFRFFSFPARSRHPDTSTGPIWMSISDWRPFVILNDSRFEQGVIHNRPNVL